MKCGYIRDTWDCGETMEIEESIPGGKEPTGRDSEKKRQPPKI